MAKLIMLSAVPGAGKSTLAKELAERENAEVLSSDALRLEILGDSAEQENPGKVFEEMFKRAREKLKKGQNVILDATHTTAKRRMGILQQFHSIKGLEKEIYYLSVPYAVCVERDTLRPEKERVGQRVIDRMTKNMQVPTYAEGWNKVHIVKYDGNESYKGQKERFESLILSDLSHYKLFMELKEIGAFEGIFDLPQDSTYHCFSVSRHTYHVYRYIMENYEGEDKLMMLWAALFHDTGKKSTKNFISSKDGKTITRYANFIQHENVSGQLACYTLLTLGYDQKFVMKVVEICNWHMRLVHTKNLAENEKFCKNLEELVGATKLEELKVKMNERAEEEKRVAEKSDKKLLSLVGKEVYDRLVFFRKADDSGK